jgi:hypothetical protein
MTLFNACIDALVRHENIMPTEVKSSLSGKVLQILEKTETLSCYINSSGKKGHWLPK